jgi:hypothetical protein
VVVKDGIVAGVNAKTLFGTGNPADEVVVFSNPNNDYEGETLIISYLQRTLRRGEVRRARRPVSLV